LYAIVHVPAPRRVMVAAVLAGDPVFVVSPATEHTDGVVVEKATTRPEFAVAVVPKAEPPNVLLVIDAGLIDCEVRLTVNVDDVTELRPVAENVTVKSPPALFILKPLKVATPEDVEAVVTGSTPNIEPDAIVAVTVVVG